METVASGVATFDYDGDGLIDIYFLNGAPLPGAAAGGEVPRNRLYRNLGALKFVDVTEAAGVGDPGFGLGVAVADYDNDGFPDIYVSNFGPNVFYRNNGDGTYSEVTQATATAAGDATKVGAGVAFLDSDGDGNLDLFVANYLKFSYAEKVTHSLRGVPIYPGPERFPHLPSVLYRNNSDGTFTDVSQESGVGRLRGPGMGVVCADFDRDGHTDIFVGNDGGPGNFLFRNNGKGQFEELGASSGAAFSAQGLAHGSMGVDCGDYDNDGWLDLFVTAYQRQSPALYRNRGQGQFEELARGVGAGRGAFNQVTWGCGLVDLDNDGHRDIFFACGHLIDNIEALDDTTSYLAAPQVLRNTGQGRYENVSAASGPGLQKKSVGRGVAFDDLDNDGRLDVVILNSRREPTVLQNDSPRGPHWLQVRLVGTRSNRDGVGAQVQVTASGLTQLAEVHSGRGYQSHFGTRLHFGMGEHARADRVEVRWIGGGTTVLESVPVDQLLTIVEEP